MTDRVGSRGAGRHSVSLVVLCGTRSLQVELHVDNFQCPVGCHAPQVWMTDMFGGAFYLLVGQGSNVRTWQVWPKQMHWREAWLSSPCPTACSVQYSCADSLILYPFLLSVFTLQQLYFELQSEKRLRMAPKVNSQLYWRMPSMN